MIYAVRKAVSLTLVITMFLLGFTMPGFAAATYPLDKVIELEATSPKGEFQTFMDKTASGGKYIAVPEGPMFKDPDGADPEISVPFEAPKDASYFVWLKYSCAGGGQDSLYAGFDDEKLNAAEYGIGVITTGEGIWGWKMIKAAELKAGVHKLKMYHRETLLKMDAVYITADSTYQPEGIAIATPRPSTAATATPPPITATPAPVKPIGTVFELQDGTAIIEAEATASKGKIEVVKDDTASGKQAITFVKTIDRIDDPVGYGDPAATYSFKVDKAGTYIAWIRAFVPNKGGDSIWSTFDNNLYLRSDLGVHETEWTWTKLATSALQPGVHTFNLVPREYVQKIDRVILTNKAGYVPTGIGEPPGSNAPGPVLYPTPSVLPPAGHPRVYFTKDDIPRILENAQKPQNADAWAKHQSNLADGVADAIKPLEGSATTNFSASVLSVIESRAFDYAIRGNVEMGKKAVTAMRNYIDTAAGGDYNALGQTVYTISVVYDWCYPLLTKEDQSAFAGAATGLAAQMEIGWPPTKQGSVTGHGVEGQLMRDLMCAGIAMYDERPDIYLNVAGRFFKEYVPARKFFYTAHMNPQGEHYTAYRSKWEMLATLIFDAIGVPQVFGPDQQYQLYWTLYARRPDGQVLRDGDSWRNNLLVGTYDTNPYRSMLLTGNYFDDPYLKWEGMREMPYLKAASPSTNQSMNCVEFMIFNKPDLGGRPSSELPLTKYFPSPKGGMIARTGWEDGFSSPAVVAEMKINEYWTTNHQHLDAGAFQIYYKGALATDSGYYQAAISKAGNTGNDGNTGYGSQHDMNYNKRTIAHNCMLVYDPKEVVSYYSNNTVDGGQRVPNNGSEVDNLEQFLDVGKGYKIGKVLGSEFGEDPIAPNYTYLKGDLKGAYSSKITGYERSFMFLNLKDKDHPAAMLVFDRVAASDGTFKKSWLLHGLQQPEINGSQTVFKDTREGYNGKLTVDTLLPKPDNITITPIGGPDKEFWVNGTNYLAATTKTGNNEGGGWRIEVSPKTASKTDYFLNILQMGDANPDMPALPVTAIETDKVAGAVVADRVVIFGKEKDRTKEAVEFSFKGDGEYEITVADLEKGTWQVTKDGVALTQTGATAEGGVVVWNGTAGAYTLTYVNDTVNRPVITPVWQEHEGIGIRVSNRLLYTDVPPTIRNDRTLVPMRAIFENLGVAVSYDETTATATATKDGREVKITENSATAAIDGQPVPLDVPATVINGRFMVPVRFVSEAFYAKVDWDDFAKIVNITPGSGPGTGGAGQAADGYVPIVASECSGYYEQTVSSLSYDNDVETLWSVSGYEGQWISYDLGDVTDLKGTSIMWNKGDQRQAIFNVEVSSDKETWTKVYNGKSSGKAALAYEDYLFPKGTKARYVKINCLGNTTSPWNAIIEIKFMRP